MQITVLVERIAGNGYKARTGEPFGLTAEASTADEAVRRLHEDVVRRVAAGAKVVSLDVPATEEHPWMAFAGTLKDYPLLEEWKRAVAEYRQSVDSDPERL